MNVHLQRILTSEARHYKTNSELKEELEQKHKDIVEALETAKKQREHVILSYIQCPGTKEPSNVKETIALYDKVIIPNLKKMEKAAYNDMFARYRGISHIEFGFLTLPVAISFPFFMYGGILGITSAAMIWIIMLFVWLRYRVIIRGIILKGEY